MSLPLDDAFDAAAALEEAGAFGEALKAYDEIFRELEDEMDYESREAAARALTHQAEILDDLGYHEDELALRWRVVERERDATEPSMQVRVARALVNTGLTYADLERRDEELATYDLVLERYGDVAEPEVENQVARALALKASRLRSADRIDEALVVNDSLLDRYGGGEGGRRRRRTARALLNKGNWLSEVRRPRDAVRAYRALERFAAGSDDEDLLDLELRARVNAAICLGRLGENREALSIYAQVIDEPIDLEREHRLEDLLRAVFNRANTLRGLGRPDEALELLRRSAERLAESQAVSLMQVASLEVARAKALASLGRTQEAVIAYDQLVAKLDSEAALAYRQTTFWALSDKARLLRSLGDRNGVAETHRAIFERFSVDPDLQLSRSAVWSGVQAVRELAKLHLPDESVALAREIVERCDAASDPYLRARARNARAVVVLAGGVRSLDRAVERRRVELAIAGATASLAAAAAWARHRARRV